jgi:hypothetical protein
MTWQFTDETQTVVTRALAGGGSESRLASTLPDEELASVTPYSAPVIVPSSVTMRQARLALLQSGLLANVTTAINSLPSPQKEAAQIEWEYSQEVQRNKPLVLALAPALGLNDAALDQLFITAATL